MLFFTLNDIDAFNRATYGYCAVCYIDVTPLQCANFSDAQSGTKVDINPQPHKSDVALDVVQNLSVIGDRQYFQFLAGGGRGVLYIPFVIGHPLVFAPELHHHFKDYQNVLDCFDTQTTFQLLQDKSLYCLFAERITISEIRKNVVLQD